MVEKSHFVISQCYTRETNVRINITTQIKFELTTISSDDVLVMVELKKKKKESL